MTEPQRMKCYEEGAMEFLHFSVGEFLREHYARDFDYREVGKIIRAWEEKYNRGPKIRPVRWEHVESMIQGVLMHYDDDLSKKNGKINYVMLRSSGRKLPVRIEKLLAPNHAGNAGKRMVLVLVLVRQLVL